MKLTTDNFCQLVLSDEAKLGNISVAGNLVFEFLPNGNVSIYQTSDNPETEKTTRRSARQRGNRFRRADCSTRNHHRKIKGGTKTWQRYTS